MTDSKGRRYWTCYANGTPVKQTASPKVRRAWLAASEDHTIAPA